MPLKLECVPVRKGHYLRTYASLIQHGQRLPNLYSSEEAKAEIPRYEQLNNGTWDTSATLAYWKEKMATLIWPQLTELQGDAVAIGDALAAREESSLSEMETSTFEASVSPKAGKGKKDQEDEKGDLPF